MPPTQKTIVRGRYDSARASDGNVDIELFASKARSARGHAQAERFLGETHVSGNHAAFEIAVPGDLTGEWVAATAAYEDQLSAVRDFTSELSEPVRVAP